MSKIESSIKKEIREVDITINVGKLEDAILDEFNCAIPKDPMVAFARKLEARAIMARILGSKEIKEQLEPAVEKIKAKEKADEEEKTSMNYDELNAFFELLKKLLD